ncbi:MAG: chromosome segregation protein SMC [Nitrospiraceae bacterium]|nr:chromosome segregation protein SMC [Nitrospiraceae bacterium]
MRIERIELTGFKSFYERTVFNLHPGITCIVGPNGCGKSNIVDSFRWVLGEQSAKSLRGEKMEEVIFNGSAMKKPKGMSDVTLVVSGLGDPTNKDNGNISDNLTQVTRRLYRTGESEYQINKSGCRLKDVKDLFLDTGLEVKSYSILEQDRISAILNSRPEDRRFIIEEVAGVMKYKARRNEAQSKLESSRLNLQRINDIVTEVKRQINSLDRQAKKAERYKKLASEMHAIELKIAKRDYEHLKESLEKILAEYTSLKDNETTKRAELSKIETTAEKNRLELLEKEKELELVQQEFRDLERSIADNERLIAVSKTEKENLKEHLIRLHTQKEELASKNIDLSQKNQELDSAESKFNVDIQGLTEELRVKNEFINSLENELREKENALETKRKEIFRATEELSNLRNDIGRLQASLEALERKETALIKDTEDSKKALDNIDFSIKGVADSLSSKNSELIKLNDEKGKFESDISSIKNQIENLRNNLSEAKEELASGISRIESLKELVLDAPAREILSEGSSLHIVSSLSDILRVDPEYEKAVENALSEKVNAFIVKSLEDIEFAIAKIKEKNLGRIAFMHVDEKNISDADEKPDDVIGRAIDFVKVESKYNDIAKNLLRNIFIVKDIKTAFKIRRKNSKALFVTLEGEIVEPSGAVIGGEGKGLLKRKRDIREIEDAVQKKKDLIEQNQKELNTLQERLIEKESQIKELEAARVGVEKELSLFKLTSDNYLDEKDRTDRKLSYLSTELDNIKNEKESIKKQITEKETLTGAGETDKNLHETQMTVLIEEISRKKTDYEKQRTNATDLKLSLTSQKEKIEALQNEKMSVKNALEEISQKEISIGQEIKSVEERILQKETEILQNDESIKGMVVNADTLSADISGRKDAIAQENQELLVHEQSIKSLRHEIDGLSSRVSELDVEKTEHRMKIENLTENIRQNYGMEINTITTEPLLPEDEERLAELKTKIQELGPVNLGTLEEYEELTKRYEFLTKQQEDLNKSIAELEEAITKINSTTRKKLRDAFDELKVKFSEVFVSLFGGGKAELVLTDENNILETGIDIIAQPPGKKFQNITLLSGGEKALTALSLLFASFLLKPTPLCILDEADAPLDESNTVRFGKMIKELSKDIQFIVITHNRVTMEAADYIYGITMEEPGSSKVISMQLIEA